VFEAAVDGAAEPLPDLDAAWRAGVAAFQDR
jgi:hypothetical protein